MKRIAYILFTAIFVFNSGYIFGQHARFAKSGIIEFEKSVNMYAIIKKSINKYNESYMTAAFEEYKKTQPQFKKLKSTLKFNGNKILFTPEPDNNAGNFWGFNPSAGQYNIVFTDLTAGKRISSKKVFEETFLVTDSTQKIKWKITTETRDIAGYHCRRANGIILDSVYLVAFYTDEIPVSGGPESFNGLPGMILGLAMPHENLSWFATKVTDAAVPQNTLTPPAKGKAQTQKQFITTILSVMKDWSDEGRSYLMYFSL